MQRFIAFNWMAAGQSQTRSFSLLTYLSAMSAIEMHNKIQKENPKKKLHRFVQVIRQDGGNFKFETKCMAREAEIINE